MPTKPQYDLTVVFPPKRVWRSRLKANLCCRVIPLCRVEYCCCRAQEEFRDSREASEASREASGTRPAWLESYDTLVWTDSWIFTAYSILIPVPKLWLQDVRVPTIGSVHPNLKKTYLKTRDTCLIAYLAVSYRQSMVFGEVLQCVPISVSRVTVNYCTETGVKMKNYSRVSDHSQENQHCVEAPVTGYKV